MKTVHKFRHAVRENVTGDAEASDSSGSSDASGTGKHVRSRRANERLSSVIPETAPQAAVEVLRSNQRFALPSGNAWAILLLKADDIGGLNKRTHRDEAKGSLVELISSDQIQIVATATMLEDETLGFIPTPDTLHQMSEFSLLTGAPYAWAVLRQDEGSALVIHLVGEATLSQAQRVSSENMELRTALGDEVWERHGGEPARPEAPSEQDFESAEVNTGSESDPAQEPPGDEPSFDESAPQFGDDVDEGDQVSFDDEQTLPDDEPQFDDDDEPPQDQDPDARIGDDLDEDDFEHGDDESNAVAEDVTSPVDLDKADQDERDQTPACVVDAEHVRETIVRRFLQEGVDLSVDLQAFDLEFSTEIPVVEIAVPDQASDWLDGQVAQMTRQANAALAQLHEHHQQQLRTTYVNLCGRHIADILEETSPTRPGSAFAQMMRSADQAHDQRREASAEQVRTEQTALREAFDREVEQEAERAATEARSRYRARHKATLDRRLQEATAVVEDQIEAARDHDRRDILGLRAEKATHLAAAGQTRITEVIAATQQEYLAAERELMQRWSEDLTRLVDDRRKQDVARVEALAEQQSREDQVAAARQEYEHQIAELTQRHEADLARTSEEMDRLRSQAQERLDQREAAWREDLEREREKSAREARVSSGLADQVEQMSVSFQQQYRERIKELESDKDSYLQDLQRGSALHWQSTRVLVAVFVAVAVLMSVAGFIVGAAAMR